MIVTALFRLFQWFYVTFVIGIFPGKNQATCLAFLSTHVSTVPYLPDIHRFGAFLTFSYHLAHGSASTIDRLVFMTIVAHLIVKHPIAFVVRYSITFSNTFETSTQSTHGCAYMIGCVIITFMTPVTK